MSLTTSFSAVGCRSRSAAVECRQLTENLVRLVRSESLPATQRYAAATAWVKSSCASASHLRPPAGRPPVLLRAARASRCVVWRQPNLRARSFVLHSRLLVSCARLDECPLCREKRQPCLDDSVQLPLPHLLPLVLGSRASYHRRFRSPGLDAHGRPCDTRRMMARSTARPPAGGKADLPRDMPAAGRCERVL